MTVFEAVCFECGAVLAKSSDKVPLKDMERWMKETRLRLEGCSGCGRRSEDPRFVMTPRIAS